MLSSRIQDKIQKMAATLGLYIYDIDMFKENNQSILRISITRKAPMEILDSQHSNAIGLQDCQNLSELISPLLDVEEISNQSYSLEVSSPGIERVLKTYTHYTFSLGENVSIRLNDKSIMEGILLDVNQNGIEAEIKGEKQFIAFSDIKKTKVTFAFN